jgi:tryptophanyl-tRNA synthetase
MQTKRVLSGIRATGRLHLGNYLGMVKGMLELQDDPAYDVFFMVADLHSITTPYDPAKFKQSVRDVVIDYLAAGLDPEKSSVFVQSHVYEHVELSYLLASEVTIARLSHLPTYKEKVRQHPKSNTMALLYYPVLMAADILLYKTEELPVGDDQVPHLEITREIARKMNEKYSTDFPEPEQIQTKGHYVPSLIGEGKMSKSVEGSYITLTDDIDTIKEKLASSPTDSGKGDKLPTEGGVANLLTFVELIQGEVRRKEYEEKYLGEGLKYKELKDELAQAIYDELEPVREKRVELEKDTDYVDKVIEDGAKKAKNIASKTLKEVKVRMGFL